ncbi:MAG: hypothetical protein AB1500_03260 [Bacillota bacterium]
MGSRFLLVALGCGQCSSALGIAAGHPLVAYGTMHGAALRLFSERFTPEQTGDYPVYFYETG